ncbi:MAG TPA: pteridine reductase [Burkholderiaceae bacterium]|nr:pteridine reductase [Burkholderiaceae bacterium]
MEPNPVVLVTGSARRIGAGVARHLHALGSAVVVHHRRSADEARQLVASLNALRPDSALALSADLADARQCAELVDAAARWKGRLGALVNNASSFYRTPIGSIDERQWSELVDGNLKAALFTSQAAAPWLRDSGGAIVNVCDVHTERPLPQFSVYTAAKAGIVALTRAFALELAPRVRVNAVAPGSLDWPEAGIFTEDERRAGEAAIPLGRLGTGDDIARAVEFLLFGNDYVTGQVLNVDGGSSLVSHCLAPH